VLIGVVIASMFAVRTTTLRDLSTPEAKAQWEAWRQAEPNRTETGPVKRRPPASSEPPALVLLRDYFPVMLAAAVVFASLLFAAIAISVRGALSTTRAGPETQSRTAEHAEGRRGEDTS
jgi:hypothetical protein